MDKFPAKSQNSPEPKTTLVPVTEENGETVTDAQGETVYETVTVETETATKSSVFSNIISSVFGNNAANAENTEPQSDVSNITDFPAEITAPAPSVSLPTKPPASTEEDKHIDENPAEVFEYEPYENSKTRISITKYKGSSSVVTVPDYINGLMVVEIQKGAFHNNSKIKTIDIIKGARSYIWLRSMCFNNLSSLTTVNLYDNNLGLSADFAVDCPIKDFNITNWQYKFVDGAIYVNNSKYWELKTFCGNPCYTTLTLPSWCKTISTSNNLNTAKNLRIINIHKDVTSIPNYDYDYNHNLEAFHVESGNNIFMSKDGVLFSKRYLNSSSTIYDALYPYSKKDKTFTMPQKEGYQFSLPCATGRVINPYIEKIYLPLNSYIGITAHSQGAFPNLKNLYFKRGNADYERIKGEFTGEIDFY